MWTIIFTLIAPILPLLLYKGFNRKQKLTKREIATRYFVYGAFILILVSGMLTIVSDGESSFWQKIMLSPEFRMKYFCLVLAAAIAAAVLQWIYCRLEGVGKTILAKLIPTVLIVVLLGTVFLNAKDYYAKVMEQRERTSLTIELINKQDANAPFVINDLTGENLRIAEKYYPNQELTEGQYVDTNADAFWYFCPSVLNSADLQVLQAGGYTASSYGGMQLDNYSFVLYYVEKQEPSLEDAWTITQYGLRENNANFYTIYNPKQGLIIVDGGWTEDAPYVRNIINYYGGVVDAWILTHQHPDHVGAFNELYKDLQDIEVREIYTVDMATPEKCLEVASWDNMDAYNDFLALNISGLQYVYPGDELTICGLEFDIYNAYDAAVKEFSRDYLNDGSMLFKVTGKSKSFLFCADVGISMSDYLLEKWGNELQADYLQMGHHGYGGLDDDFYQAVAPDIAFFDAPDWMMLDTTGTYDNPENAAFMQSIGAEVVSFNSAPNKVVLE